MDTNKYDRYLKVIVFSVKEIYLLQNSFCGPTHKHFFIVAY